MSSWLRLLIVCALMLALPLKVLAGVSLGCAAGSHPQAEATTVPDGPAHDHARHDHGAHGHHGMTVEHGGAAPAADPHDDAASTGCSHCAPCCAAALPAAELQRLPAVHPEPHAAPFLGGLHADVVADVPDRPPRASLA